jgi:hypothetical protein
MPGKFKRLNTEMLQQHIQPAPEGYQFGSTAQVKVLESPSSTEDGIYVTPGTIDWKTATGVQIQDPANWTPPSPPLNKSRKAAKQKLADSLVQQRAESPHSVTARFRRYLDSISNASVGKRLWALRDANSTILVNTKGETIAFTIKDKARTIRDDLDKTFHYKAFVTKGPDHRDTVALQ